MVEEESDCSSWLGRRIELGQYPINSARRSHCAQARLRSSSPAPETMFTTETATTAGNFADARPGQDDAAAWRLTIRSLSRSWILLNWPGFLWVVLVCAWISLDLFWISVDFLGFRSRVFNGLRSTHGVIWRLFSPRRSRSRPSGENDHELNAHGSEGLRHADGDPRSWACNSHRSVPLLFSQAEDAPRAAGTCGMVNGDGHGSCGRTPSRLPTMALMHEPGSGEDAFAMTLSLIGI